MMVFIYHFFSEVEEEETETDLTAKETNVSIETPQTRKDSKRREGLVTEIIISVCILHPS
jgi:hypothetical protein